MSLIFPPRPEDFKFPEAKSPRLRIVSYSDAVRTLIIRGLTKTGLIHDTYSTTDIPTPETRIIALTEIPLTLYVETPSPAVERGRLYIQIFLEFSGVPATLLAAGYVTTASPLVWPGSPIQSPTEGHGFRTDLRVTAPSPGSDFHLTPPGNTLWRIDAARFTFTTSPALDNRICRLCHFNNHLDVATYYVPTASQGPNLTNEYIFSPYNNVPAKFNGYIMGEFVPIWLHPSSVLASRIQYLHAGDSLSDIAVALEQWLNP